MSNEDFVIFIAHNDSVVESSEKVIAYIRKKHIQIG